jgi:hypothetical protein
MRKRKAWKPLVLLGLIQISIVLSARALGWQPFLLPPRQWGVTKSENTIVTPHNLVVVEVVKFGYIGLRHRTVYSERVRQLWLNRARRTEPRRPS